MVHLRWRRSLFSKLHKIINIMYSMYLFSRYVIWYYWYFPCLSPCSQADTGRVRHSGHRLGNVQGRDLELFSEAEFTEGLKFLISKYIVSVLRTWNYVVTLDDFLLATLQSPGHRSWVDIWGQIEILSRIQNTKIISWHILHINLF